MTRPPEQAPFMGLDGRGLMALTAREAVRRAKDSGKGLWAAFATLRPYRSERLLIAPQDLRTADPTIAADIYAGYFSLKGRVVATGGRSPFEVVSPTSSWAESLHSFAWLRHLRAAGTILAQANARSLIDEWIRIKADRRGVARLPHVAARRLMAWLKHSPLIVEGADHRFYNRFMKALLRNTALVERQLALRRCDSHRVLNALALSYAALCLEGQTGLLKTANRALADALETHILPDGGPISRNPALLVDYLLDCLPLKQAYAARGLEPPPQLLNAIDRMMPMLRMMRHGDGSLALFNGMGVTAPDLIATLFAYDATLAKPMAHAPHSGYERLEMGGSVLIADVGKAPPLPFSGQAHAGCLSFEFSSGANRLIINCGAPLPCSPAGTMPARLTQAHSTVSLGQRSSLDFVTSRDSSSLRTKLHNALCRWIGPLATGGASTVKARRIEGEQGMTLIASHDAWRGSHGLTFERHWTLFVQGQALEGEDIIIRDVTDLALSEEAVIRFHLHPGVQPQPQDDGSSALLTLAHGEAWVFAAHGHAVSLEDSVLFASPEGMRRTMQLVIRAPIETAHAVKWSLRRVA